MLVIIATTIVLIIYDYNPRTANLEKNRCLDIFMVYTTYYYIAEFLIKIIAQGGLVHRNAYFKDRWNWIDFIVVAAGITEVTNIPNVPLKVFRTLRVLRPLRSIKQFPRMKRLVNGLVDSFSSLANALLFMFFVFL